jgi:HD superfamily phosphodiesterase
MQLNCDNGKELMTRYLAGERLQTRLIHSIGVGDLAYKIALRVAEMNPELGLDPEFVGFFGYSHDIGYSIQDGKHEVFTVELLVNEGLPQEIARYAMHGQLAEQFGEKEGNVSQYMPVGIEGMILTYADMSFRTGEPVSMEERAKEIVTRIKGIPTMPAELKADIEANLYKALPRFQRYERTLLTMGGVNSITEF